MAQEVSAEATQELPKEVEQELEKKEQKVKAKEDLVFLTSGAKEKFSKTLVGASETAYKMMHPFSQEHRDHATERAKELKKEVEDQQAAIRTTAHQQAEADRMEIAQQRGVPGAMSPRALPSDAEVETEKPQPQIMRPSPNEPADAQSMFVIKTPYTEESNSSSSSSDGSNRANIPPSSADYRSG